MHVSKTFVEKRQKSHENITTELGALLRVNGSIKVEGAFGILKYDDANANVGIEKNKVGGVAKLLRSS